MRNKQPVDAATVFLLALAAAGCHQGSRSQASEAEEKAKTELHHMAAQAKQDAHRLDESLSKGMNGRPSLSAQEAEGKLAKAGTRVGEAARVAQVKAKLTADLGLSAATNIRVDCREGVVTLHGEAESADQKRMATESAQAVDGVTRVVNDLTIQPPRR